MPNTTEVGAAVTLLVGSNEEGPSVEGGHEVGEGCDYTAAGAGNVTTLRFHFDPLSEAGTIELGIYADNGGEPSKPGALLASVTVPVEAGQTVVEGAIPPTAVVEGTKYWLLFASEGPVEWKASFTGVRITVFPVSTLPSEAQIAEKGSEHVGRGRFEALGGEETKEEKEAKEKAEKEAKEKEEKEAKEKAEKEAKELGPDGLPRGYDIRLGPLSFVAMTDHVGEVVGDGLEVVGSALVAGERHARSVQIQVAVRGDALWDADTAKAGRQLRRWVRQLLNNADWRLQGFYFIWEPDADMDGWLMIGSGNLAERDPGVTFGEYELTLNDVYLAGRAGTHRPGRRSSIVDLRDGIAPRDSRRLLYSSDFAETELPDHPVVLPGDLVSLVSSRGVSVLATKPPWTKRGERTAFRFAEAVDGEVFSYRQTVLHGLNGRDGILLLDSLGSVRMWDTHAALVPARELEPSAEGDADPAGRYGWEAVYGATLTSDHPLVIENDVCRVRYLGALAPQLIYEVWSREAEGFVKVGELQHAEGVSELSVVELTPERGVLEIRNGGRILRIVLQRGWTGPKLESYNDEGGNALVEFNPFGGGLVKTTVAGFVIRVSNAEEELRTLFAPATADTESSGAAEMLVGGVQFSRSRVCVLTVGFDPVTVGGWGAVISPKDLASLSVIDARAVPVLLGR